MIPMGEKPVRFTFENVGVSAENVEYLESKFKQYPKFKFLAELLNKSDETRFNPAQSKAHKTLIGNLAELRPFVIEPEALAGKQVDISFEDRDPPDLPFKFCAFEMSTPDVRPIFNLPQIKVREQDLPQDNSAIPATIVPVLLVYEEAPGHYYFAALELWGGHMSCSIWQETVENKGISFTPMLREILRILLSKELGTVKLRPYIQVGKGRNRGSIRPKDIVFVSKTRQEQKSFFDKEVDWSHRWEVMGHWRTTSGLGKDRDGHYCIMGKTWVKSHVKGKGEFIKKTRIILPSEHQPQL